VGVTTTICLMAGSVLLAIHSALRVLPQFALIEPIGRHCPEAVLRRALKEGGLRQEEAAALAAQLGVALPGSSPPASRWGWLSLSSAQSVASFQGDDDDRATREGRLAARLLGMCASSRGATIGSDSGRGSSSSGSGSDSDGSGSGSERSGPAPPRRSLENIKSASVAQLLNLLAEQPAAVRPWLTQQGEGPAGAGAGGAWAPESPTSSAAPTPYARNGTGTPGGTLQRTSLTSLAGSAAAGAGHARGGGGGHGGGHGGGGGGHGGGAHGLREPSSNVELAGEMLRAIILKQARAEQAGGGGGGGGGPLGEQG
jgi:hypothetical protein